MIVIGQAAHSWYCCELCSQGGCIRVSCPGEGCACVRDHGHAESPGEAVRLQQERLITSMVPVDEEIP